jgi:ribosomal protein L19E
MEKKHLTKENLDAITETLSREELEEAAKNLLISKQPKFDLGNRKNKGAGPKGTYGRKILYHEIEEIDGKTYNNYYHATKGWKRRLVTPSHTENLIFNMEKYRND